MPGFGEGGAHPSRRASSRTRSCGCSTRSARGPAARRGRSSTSTSTSSRRAASRVAQALEPFDLLWLEVDVFDPGALAHVRHVAPMPICSGENLYDEPRLPAVPRGRRDGRRLGRRHLERLPPGEEDRRPRRDVRGQLRAAQLLLATSRRSSPRSGARRSRTSRILEVDVDDVPWRDELVTAVRRSRKASCDPGRTGWGVDVREDVLREHPWPRVRRLGRRPRRDAAAAVLSLDARPPIARRRSVSRSDLAPARCVRAVAGRVPARASCERRRWRLRCFRRSPSLRSRSC